MELAHMETIHSFSLLSNATATCSPTARKGSGIAPSRPEVGHLLAIRDAGAYGMAQAST